MKKYDYRLDNYRRLIEHFKQVGYAFSPYRSDAYAEKSVLLRHDIDYTLAHAETFARINADAGVAGTFFFQLRSSLYNFFNFDVQSVVRRIIDMGQHVGFHAVVDSHFDSLDDLRLFIANEFRIFSDLVPESHPVFAWHNPGVLTLDGFNFIEADFPGLINTYGDIGGGRPPYFADSNMRHTFDQLYDIGDQGHPLLQLALAPMQWCPEQEAMENVMVSTLLRKVKELDPGFLDNGVFREMFPEGIPPKALDEFGRLCMQDALPSNYSG